MRRSEKAFVVAVIAFGLMLQLCGAVVASAQPTKSLQLQNAYYPFSVELSVRDR